MFATGNIILYTLDEGHIRFVGEPFPGRRYKFNPSFNRLDRRAISSFPLRRRRRTRNYREDISCWPQHKTGQTLVFHF